MNVLSIQSSVVYGRVGNRAAVPVAGAARPRRLAGGHRRLLEPSRARLVPRPDRPRGRGARPRRGPRGARRAGALRRGPVRLSRRPGHRAPWSRMRSRAVRAANPRTLYCCDPVIGEVGRGVYVRAGIPEAFPRPTGPAGRHRHAEPVRAGAPLRRSRPRISRPRGPPREPSSAAGPAWSSPPGSSCRRRPASLPCWRHARRGVARPPPASGRARLGHGRRLRRAVPRRLSPPSRRAGRAGACRRRAGRGARRRGDGPTRTSCLWSPRRMRSSIRGPASARRLGRVTRLEVKLEGMASNRRAGRPRGIEALRSVSPPSEGAR